jgi:hypothetical protein
MAGLAGPYRLSHWIVYSVAQHDESILLLQQGERGTFPQLCTVQERNNHTKEALLNTITNQVKGGCSREDFFLTIWNSLHDIVFFLCYFTFPS